MSLPETQLDRVVADKMLQRAQARAKTWPEKVAAIERLRDTARLARESMRKRSETGSSR